MTHQQLTVLTGNSAPDLGRVIDRLGAEGLDIRAHCLVDNGDGNCKLRLIVSDPERALQTLRDQRVAAVVNDVVMVETDDKPGGLSRLLAALQKEDLRIEFSYTAASRRPGVAVMVFRFSDNEKACGILEKAGMKLLRPVD